MSILLVAIEFEIDAFPGSQYWHDLGFTLQNGEGAVEVPQSHEHAGLGYRQAVAATADRQIPAAYVEGR